MLLRTTNADTFVTAAAATAFNVSLPTLPDLGGMSLPASARRERRIRGKEEQEEAFLSFGEVFGSFSRQQQLQKQRQQRQQRQREALLEEYLNALMKVEEGPAKAAGVAADIACVLRAAFQPEEEAGARREDLLIRLRTEPVPDMTSVRRDELWARQGGRCRGCGQRLLKGLLEKKNFMTCRYLQALFCTKFCADNKSSSSNSGSSNTSSTEVGTFVLPGQVLTKWDFRLRRVAFPALVFLRSIRRLPIFSLAAVWSMTTFPTSRTSVIQRQIKYLQNLRRQLSHLCAGLLVLLPTSSLSSSSPSVACVCPMARRLIAPVLQSRPHFVLRTTGNEENEDEESVSLVDLQELQSGVLSDVLSTLLEALHSHVVEGGGRKECRHCMGRGQGPASGYALWGVIDGGEDVTVKKRRGKE